LALREEWERQGNLLFRWRSYIPLIIVIFLVPAIEEYSHFSHVNDSLWEIGTFIFSLTGEMIRILTVSFVPRGTSGRVTHRQVAERLNTTGIYSIVRHPLYLGNFIIWVGAFSFFRVWWFVVIGILLFWIYYERIMYAEEEFLRRKFGKTFEEWAEKTSAFIPDLKKFVPPDLPFSFKTMLKREHTSLFGIISAFTFFEIIKGFITEGKFYLSLFWEIVFLLGLLQYTAIFILKKFTHLLDVEGR